MTELTKKQVEWKEHLDAAAAAKQSLAEYARTHGLELKKLYSYSSVIKNRLSKGTTKTKPAFVRVQRPVMATVDVHIKLTNGIQLTAPADLGALCAQLAKLP